VKKINLGSGPIKGKNGWVNIDLKEGADLVHDLTQGIPASDNSIEYIYTSHFLEHLPPTEINFVLKECFRTLNQGGTLSIAVPNARLFIEAYTENRMKIATLNNGQSMRAPYFLLEPGEMVYKDAIINTGSAIDWINYIAYSNQEHQYLFDEENLLAHLRNCGFNNAHLRQFDPCIDLESGRHSSLYAEAIKGKESELGIKVF
jgi:SAM-dependent methyltransferase